MCTHKHTHAHTQRGFYGFYITWKTCMWFKHCGLKNACGLKIDSRCKSIDSTEQFFPLNLKHGTGCTNTYKDVKGTYELGKERSWGFSGTWHCGGSLFVCISIAPWILAVYNFGIIFHSKNEIRLEVELLKLLHRNLVNLFFLPYISSRKMSNISQKITIIALMAFSFLM